MQTLPTPSGGVLANVLLLLLEWIISSCFTSLMKHLYHENQTPEAERKPPQWLARIEPAPLHLRIGSITETAKFVVYVGQTTLLNIFLIYEILYKMTTNTPPDGVSSTSTILLMLLAFVNYSVHVQLLVTSSDIPSCL
jgi:hypothetical protein